MALPSPVRGILHTYTTTPSPLTAFEHDLASSKVGLSSAGAGWGGSSIKRDAEELHACVDYFEKLGKEAIVLMGHSTGCQDLIAYHHLRPSSSLIKASVLQAPVSDREYLLSTHGSVPTHPTSSSDFVPLSSSELFEARSGITTRRWKSLVGRPESDEVDLEESEDFFSSDLSDRRLGNVFGAIEQGKLLMLLGDKDEAYPAEVAKDLDGLVGKFKKATRDGVWSDRSRILTGANHAVTSEGPREEMIKVVVEFIETL